MVPPPPTPGSAATLGLHCYGLAVQLVSVNGIAVPFDLETPVRSGLQDVSR